MKEAGLKNGFRIRRLTSLANLALILLLISFSIYGAFTGADKARRFFNSLTLTVYWFAYLFLLIWAFFVFKRLLTIRGLFMLHLGGILILAGGMWGSRAGLKIQNSIFNKNIIHTGQMYINEGQSQKLVNTESQGQQALPFEIKLVDFIIEYYVPGDLIIKTADGTTGFKVPAEPGQKIDLGPGLGSVTIVQRFENFRIYLENGRRTATDDPNGRPNAALELLVKAPNGVESTKYVFERFGGHTNPNDMIRFFYVRTIRDFISDVEVIQNNNVMKRKSIEVNKPLHFAGYYFYQESYDEQAGRFTVLRVASDSGLGVVYLGYILLCAGAFWHLWFRHLFGDREIED